MPLIRKPSTAAPDPAPPADLGSPSADLRWAAARRMGAPEDAPVLAAALERESEPRVREAILTSLARIGGPLSVQALVRQIRSDDASARTAALDALRGMAADVDTVLPDLLADPDADVRVLACELARAAPAGARLLCELIMREQQVNVAAAAVEVLSEVGDRRSLPALAGVADRFADQPFLLFAIQVARDRMGAV